MNRKISPNRNSKIVVDNITDLAKKINVKFCLLIKHKSNRLTKKHKVEFTELSSQCKIGKHFYKLKKKPINYYQLIHCVVKHLSHKDNPAESKRKMQNAKMRAQ